MSALFDISKMRKFEKIDRRSFAKRFALAAGGLAVFPNLITNRSYAGVCVIRDADSEKSICVQNGSFARQFDIGTWTTARFCFHMYMTKSDGNNPDGALAGNPLPYLYLGVCSGSSAQILDASTTNYIGIKAKMDQYNSGSSGQWRPDTNAMTYIKKVGSTTTEISANSYYGASGNNACACIWIFRVTKGSPNWTTQLLLWPNDGSTMADATTAQFEAQCVALVPAFSYHAADGAKSGAFDEVAGTINHITAAWPRWDSELRFKEIMVVKEA